MRGGEGRGNFFEVGVRGVRGGRGGDEDKAVGVELMEEEEVEGKKA